MKSFSHLLNEINEGSTHAALTNDLGMSQQLTVFPTATQPIEDVP